MTQEINFSIPLFCREFADDLESALPKNEGECRDFCNRAREIATRIELTPDKIREARRSDDLMAPEELMNYLRSKERNSITSKIIQYLSSFVKCLPDPAVAENEIVNPFHQFQGFVTDLVNQLEEKDVQKAIMRDLENRGRVTEGNEWYYKGRIREVIKVLRARLDSIADAGTPDWCTLFEILRDFCHFWFCLRNAEPRRIRLADQVMYQLATLLLRRNQNQTAPPETASAV